MQFNRDIQKLCSAQATTTEAIKDIGKQIEQLVKQHDKDICHVVDGHDRDIRNVIEEKDEDINNILKVLETMSKRLSIVEDEFTKIKNGYQAINFVKTVLAGLIGSVVGAIGFMLLLYELGSKIGGLK